MALPLRWCVWWVILWVCCPSPRQPATTATTSTHPPDCLIFSHPDSRYLGSPLIAQRTTNRQPAPPQIDALIGFGQSSPFSLLLLLLLHSVIGKSENGMEEGYIVESRVMQEIFHEVRSPHIRAPLPFTFRLHMYQLPCALPPPRRVGFDTGGHTYVCMYVRM